jgi:hypothetical protein
MRTVVAVPSRAGRQIARSEWGVFVVGRRSDPPDPNDVYESFVRELAASPERAGLLVRLGSSTSPTSSAGAATQGTHTIGSATRAHCYD